jgi:hypothetical protein
VPTGRAFKLRLYSGGLSNEAEEPFLADIDSLYDFMQVYSTQCAGARAMVNMLIS